MRIMSSWASVPRSLLPVVCTLLAHIRCSAQQQQCGTATSADMAGPFYQFSVPPSMTAQTAVVCGEGGVQRGGVTAPGGTDGSALGTQVDWLHVTGVIRAADGAGDCGAPIPSAELHVWQADQAGHYDSHIDTSSWDCRAVLFADSDGRYSYLTLKPGPYTGRPTHIHLKVFAAGYHELTTQMYFDEEPAGCGPGQANAGSCADDLIVTFSRPGTLGTDTTPRTGNLDLWLAEDLAQARWLGEGNPCEDTERNLCDVHAMCIHTGPGVHQCECLNGYEGNGGHCLQLMDTGELCEHVGAAGEASVGACSVATQTVVEPEPEPQTRDAKAARSNGGRRVTAHTLLSRVLLMLGASTCLFEQLR